MMDYYDELKLSSSLDTAALYQELNKLESLWRRREVTNPEKAAKMIALIIEAREKFKDERSRRDYDLQLEQSKRKPEQLDPNAERLRSFMEWRNKAVSFHDEKQHDLAQSALERALSYMPADYEDSFFFNQAALIYLGNYNCNAAMNYINKAIIIDTCNPDFYLTKGLVYNGFANSQYVNVTDQQNYYVKSEEMFLKARDLAAQKNMRMVRANAAGALALYYNMKNDESRAEAFAQEARELGDSSGRAQEVLEYIRFKREKRQELAKKRKQLSATAGLVAVGAYSIVGVKADGAVLKVLDFDNNLSYCLYDGDLCWQDMISVSAGSYEIVGLQADGTVERVVIDKRMKEEGDARNLNVPDWRDIVAVAAGECTFGLKADGTLAAGNDLDNSNLREVFQWKDITAISACINHIVGLKEDGTVVAAGYAESGACNVSHWRDIVAVSAGIMCTAGLKTDGTVVVVGKSGWKYNVDPKPFDADRIAAWQDIVAVSAGHSHIVGLKSDGTVVAEGIEEGEACNVSGWRDIVAVFAGVCLTIGIRSDGTLVSTEQIGDISSWKLFDRLETIEEERRLAKQQAVEKKQREEEELRRREEEELRRQEEERRLQKLESERKEAERALKRSELEAEQTSLRAELSHSKGFFKGQRRRQIESRLEEIAAEIRRL